MLAREAIVVQSIGLWEKIAGAAFGLAFVIVILIIAIRFPIPTPFQFFVFRVVLALSGAGLGGILSGFLSIVIGNQAKPWLRAGGALAVFVLIYLVNPAKLIVQ